MPLGGEFAFAIDGPLLPTPSWKLVFEVNEPAHLQATLESVVNEVNKEAAKFGKKGLAWQQADLGGRKYYAEVTRFGLLEVNYTYANGYMIIGPSRALVERVDDAVKRLIAAAFGAVHGERRLTVTQTSQPSSITTSAVWFLLDSRALLKNFRVDHQKQ